MAHLRRRRGGVSLGLLSLLLVGAPNASLLSCTPVVGSSGQLEQCGVGESEGRSLELGYYTSADAEKAAFNYLWKKVTGSYVGSEAREAKSRNELLERLEDPDSSLDYVLLNGGSDVLWAAGQPTATASLGLLPLDVLFEAGAVDESAYFPRLLRPAFCAAPHVFALPIGIHRTNVLFLNRSAVLRVLEAAWQDCSLSEERTAFVQLLAERFGWTPSEADTCARGIRIEPPTSGEEVPLHDAAELVALLELSATYPAAALAPCGATSRRAPLAIPFGALPDAKWPLTLVFFENLMVSRPQIYEAVWHSSADGPGCPTGSEKSVVAEGAPALLADFEGLARRAYETEDWGAAVRDVARGCAVATITGDWAQGELQTTAADPERDEIMVVPFPGTEDAFVFVTDTTASRRSLSSSTVEGCAGQVWFRNAANWATLMEYSRIKGSIPPLRFDPRKLATTERDEYEALSSYQKRSYERFRDCYEKEDPSCRLLWAASGVTDPSAALGDASTPSPDWAGCDEMGSGGLASGGMATGASANGGASSGGLGQGGEGGSGSSSSGGADSGATGGISLGAQGNGGPSSTDIAQTLRDLWSQVENCPEELPTANCGDLGRREELKRLVISALKDNSMVAPYCPQLPDAAD